MNIFCLKGCTGGDIKEIKRCNDRYCPFYPFRRANLNYQNKRRQNNDK